MSAPVFVRWIRKCGRIVKQHLISTEIPEYAKEIEILEIDELLTYYKKTNQAYMGYCGQK